MKYIKWSTIDLVKTLLKEHHHLRDSDNKLLANVWFLKAEKVEEGAMDFLKLIADGKLPDAGSIRRCRRKLQEENPELRGKLWDKRHKMQTQVQEEIREMEND